MKTPLDMLRMALGNFASGLQAPESMSDPSGMARARQQVHREHGGAGIVADTRSIMASVASFRRTGEVEGFRDLKYVCLGIGAVDSRGWCTIADSVLRGQLVDLVEVQPEIRRRIRCFQALLSSYWTFPLNGKQASDESKAGWRELRAWLRAERERILKSKEPKPPWFAALTKHAALLTDQPCEKFGAAQRHALTVCHPPFGRDPRCRAGWPVAVDERGQQRRVQQLQQPCRTSEAAGHGQKSEAVFGCSCN